MHRKIGHGANTKITAKALRKEADFYIDMSKLNEDLKEITFMEKGAD
jgi:ABC-type uncharacterized transport system fused permease/ATPase subunit